MTLLSIRYRACPFHALPPQARGPGPASEADLATIWQQDWQYQPNAAIMYVGKGGIVTALKPLL